MLAGFIRDLRFALRRARHSPGFAVTVVLTLALGIGASTTIFSVAYGVLLRRLPYQQADRLVVLRLERTLEGVQRPVRAFFPLIDLPALQSATGAFDAVALYATDESTLQHAGFTGPVNAAFVTGTFFATVAGPLQSGRGLAPGDGDRGSAVIGERLSRRLFGAEPGIGRALSLGGRTYEIVGVAARTFQIPSHATDVWLLATDARCCPYAAVARLREGVTAARAKADVNALLPSLASKNPRQYEGARADAVGIREEIAGDVRRPLLVLLASAGLLLAVACANVTNLILARNATRSRETAVRIALGASRGRLAAESLADATLAVAPAGGLAVLIAAACTYALGALQPAGLPRLDAVRVDLPVVLFAIALAATVSVVIGLLPAIARAPAMSWIRTGGAGAAAGPRGRRVHGLLVVAQLAVSVVLLVSAGLLARSLIALTSTSIGVRSDHVATAAINLTYQRKLSDAQQLAAVDAIVERVRSLPNVQYAGLGGSLPPNASSIVVTLKRSGDTVDYQATAVPATPGYFSALGIPLLKGRFFTEADRLSGPEVMIMTADTVRRFFDDPDPIGRTLRLPVLRNGAAGSADVTLVGVIGNIKHSGLEAAPDDAVYRPLRQQPWPSLFLVARTSDEPETLASKLRPEIAAIDAGIAIGAVTTLDAIVAREAAPPRFRTGLLIALATFTLLIAAVGLYGVTAHAVSQRTAEFGVRLALGATPRQLLSLVYRDGAALAAVGLGVGLIGAVVATRVLARLFFGVSPGDPVSLAAAAVLMAGVATAALHGPARRAARSSPLAALRAE